MDFWLPPEVESAMRAGIAEALPQLTEMLGGDADPDDLEIAIMDIGAEYWLCRHLHEQAQTRKAHRQRLERLIEHLDGAFQEMAGFTDNRDYVALRSMGKEIAAAGAPIFELRQKAEAALDALGPRQGDHKRAADLPADWFVVTAVVLWMRNRGDLATRTEAFLGFVETLHEALTAEPVSFKKAVERHFRRAKAPA